LSEPKVGDLVVVVDWPCCGGGLGLINVIARFIPRLGVDCSLCRKWTGLSRWNTGGIKLANDWYVPHGWYKLVPPYSELAGKSTEEELKLPNRQMREAAERYKQLVTSK
jgi:hypothetical protein